MDVNTFITSGPIYALLGVLSTIVVNYIIQKSKGATDVQIVERRTLSIDQEKFKQSILDELKDCRTGMERLSRDNITWQEKTLALQEQKLVLTEEIIHLNQRLVQMDNRVKLLQETVDGLREEKHE